MTDPKSLAVRGGRMMQDDGTVIDTATMFAEIHQALAVGVATETTLAAVLAKLIAAPATEATLAAILAKLIAAPATEASLAALLASAGAKAGAAITDPTAAADLIQLGKGLLKQLQGTGSGAAPVALTGSNAAVSDTITRPNNADAYAAGDVVSTTAGEVLEFASVGTAGDVVVVLGTRLQCNVSAVPAGCVGYRLHLYNASPTAIADNAAYDLPAGDRATYLGHVAISVPIDLGATIASQDDNVNFTAKLAGTSLFGILQTIGAYTPTAEAVKTITLTAARV